MCTWTWWWCISSAPGFSLVHASTCCTSSKPWYALMQWWHRPIYDGQQIYSLICFTISSKCWCAWTLVPVTVPGLHGPVLDGSFHANSTAEGSPCKMDFLKFGIQQVVIREIREESSLERCTKKPVCDLLTFVHLQWKKSIWPQFFLDYLFGQGFGLATKVNYEGMKNTFLFSNVFSIVSLFLTYWIDWLSWVERERRPDERSSSRHFTHPTLFSFCSFSCVFTPIFRLRCSVILTSKQQ